VVGPVETRELAATLACPCATDSGRGVSRRDWLAAVVIAVVAVAVAAFLLRDTGDDPAPRSEDAPPSERVMTAAAADELTELLSERGWRCYDSLPEPVVQRCLLDERAGDGTTSADVALTFADGYVARVNIAATGERDGGRHVEVGEQAARIAGDVLLDGAGDALADRLGDRDETQIAGRRVFGNRAPGSSIQVVVESVSYDADLPAPSFPPTDALVRAAETAGLLCHDDGSSTTCSGTAGTVSTTVTIAVVADRVGTLSMSASNVAVPDDPAVVNMVSGYVFETGLGGRRASAWVRDHATGTTPVRADLGGLQFRLGSGGDRAVYLSVGEITN
jgi:hypothetical protein